MKEGEILALVGANGAGKSTLCFLLNGLILPSKGRVMACGLDTSDRGNLPRIRRLVGLIMQNPDNQIVGPTVEDDIAFGLENQGLARREMRQRVEDALRTLDLTGLRDREPDLISAGERKRLAIAGVLALGPRVLVSDESTSMLDPPTRSEVLRLFSRLREERGLSIVHATHSPEEILAADRVALLGGGRLLFEGGPEDLFDNPDFTGGEALRPPAIFDLARHLEKEGFDMPALPREPCEVVESLWP